VTFTLDPRLAADTHQICDLALCRALLMNDARNPWLILVPRRADLTEIIDLDRADRGALIEEIACGSEAVRALPGVDKINIGALGNIVRQLHVHVVGRTVGDAAWPGPVWGAGVVRRYEPAAAAALVEGFRRALMREGRCGDDGSGECEGFADFVLNAPLEPEDLPVRRPARIIGESST
jgi:diadenosine tetraphosphate (Ap4A) HIT family hydrolase